MAAYQQDRGEASRDRERPLGLTLWQEIPDPSRPWLNAPPGISVLGPRWHNYHARRAKILAAARGIMAESGFGAVFIRSVADRSGLSIQSIYNIVGNRDSLMGAASADWVLSIAAVALERARREGLNGAFSIIEASWNAPFVRRDYVENAALASQGKMAPLNRSHIAAGVGVLETELKRLAVLEALRAPEQAASLARQLIVLTHATICDWVLEPYPVAQFRAELQTGPGNMLLGALLGEERKKLERYLALMPTA